MNNVKIPSYSLGEELINSISHGIGASFGIVALVLCVIKAHGAMSIVASALYGSFMIIMYIISCIYHALSPKLRGKKVFRILDHLSVFLMEAGTYMPICLALFPPLLGWSLFIVVWIITITVIVFNIINLDKYEFVSVICNLILGWGILLLINPLRSLCTNTGLIFLIVGGSLYTIGAILFGIGSKIKYIHCVFHFFVIAGSIIHFFFIYLYCL